MKQRLKEELAQSFAEIEAIASGKADCVKMSEKEYLKFVRREGKKICKDGKKS